MHEAKKRPKRLTSTLLVSDEERLDTLMLALYGCTLKDFYARVYDAGFREGKKEGYSAGRRAAKGLKPAKANGRPFEINKELRVLMQSEVDRRMSGMPVDQAIKKYLQKMRLGGKALGKPEELPSIKKAKAAYYRDRKRKVPISSF
jgi:hypothetical protein